MARPRRSRTKAETRLKSKPGRGGKRAGKTKAGKLSSAVPAPPLDDLVRAAARALAIAIKADWVPAITANLAANLRFAAQVADFALPDESEPAPVFTA
jgi:hypothetical protein